MSATTEATAAARAFYAEPPHVAPHSPESRALTQQALHDEKDARKSLAAAVIIREARRALYLLGDLHTDATQAVSPCDAADAIYDVLRDVLATVKLAGGRV